MRIGGGYMIFEKITGVDAFNYFKVNLFLPELSVYEDNGWSEVAKYYVLKADTIATFIISDCHWYVGVQFLGVGFSAKRQWDY
jgi:hypothetical protein